MTHIYCTACTLPQKFCICASAPQLNTQLKCHILFHPRELERRNSTGRLLKHCLKIESTSWHRLKNQQQAEFFKGYHLLYPETPAVQTSQPPAVPNNEEALKKLSNKESVNGVTGIATEHPASKPPIKGLLLIDATWQESQKMLRQSPWLNALSKFSLSHKHSLYQLRRNQSEDGLCTIESLAHALAQLNHRQASQDLLHFFNDFQQAFLQARQSGLLK